MRDRKLGFQPDLAGRLPSLPTRSPNGEPHARTRQAGSLPAESGWKPDFRTAAAPTASLRLRLTDSRLYTTVQSLRGCAASGSPLLRCAPEQVADFLVAGLGEVPVILPHRLKPLRRDE